METLSEAEERFKPQEPISILVPGSASIRVLMSRPAFRQELTSRGAMGPRAVNLVDRALYVGVTSSLCIKKYPVGQQVSTDKPE